MEASRTAAFLRDRWNDYGRCGRLVKHERYYWLLLAESHLTQRPFGAMVRRIAALPVATGKTEAVCIKILGEGGEGRRGAHGAYWNDGTCRFWCSAAGESGAWRRERRL